MTKPPLPPAPPDSVEALVFGLSMTIRSLSEPDETGHRDAHFEFHCTDCGGYILDVVNEADDLSPVLCKACGRYFGTLQAVRAMGRDLVRRHLTSPGT